MDPESAPRSLLIGIERKYSFSLLIEVLLSQLIVSTMTTYCKRGVLLIMRFC